jgi:hypothetical protein
MYTGYGVRGQPQHTQDREPATQGKVFFYIYIFHSWNCYYYYLFYYYHYYYLFIIIYYLFLLLLSF